MSKSHLCVLVATLNRGLAWNMKETTNSKATISSQLESTSIKTSINPKLKLIAATLLAAASSGAMMLPFAAHADGGGDRKQNAAFYQSLDQWESAPEPSTTASLQSEQPGSAKADRHQAAGKGQESGIASTHKRIHRKRSAHVGFISPVGTQAPGRVTVTAPAESENADGYFITYPNAEATGAAEGQTANRAINNLD